MTAWTTLCRVGNRAAVFLLLLVAPFSSLVSAADEPSKSSKSPIAKQNCNATQLPEATAEAAEKAGDWDAASHRFAYCHLFVADRNSSDVREKLNTALRRAQQLRRHRDPQFQRFVATTSVSDALNLFGEVITKVPVLYVERDRSTPQLLWESGIEELSRALKNPTFRQVFLDSASGRQTDRQGQAGRISSESACLGQAAPVITDAQFCPNDSSQTDLQRPGCFQYPRSVGPGSRNGLWGMWRSRRVHRLLELPSQLNPDSVSADPRPVCTRRLPRFHRWWIGCFRDRVWFLGRTSHRTPQGRSNRPTQWPLDGYGHTSGAAAGGTSRALSMG